MSYSAIEKMRKQNLAQFGKDVGPFQPPLIGKEARGMDLKSTALRFLEKRCTDLRFDSRKEEEEETRHIYLGSSLEPNQIPYNMQMDLDRLCLKNELAKFIDSGVAEDAYTVYYAFMEMFIGKEGQSQSMVELLSEFESNASSLLMSHRDHYSHSVYVFTLGLAIFETNPWFRKVFSDFYRMKDGGEGKESAHAFLEYWGLTSLFHDIGYPFEIPFEQVLSYFEVDKKKRGKDELIYIAYKNVNPLIRIGEADGAKLEELYKRPFADLIGLLAYGITEKLGSFYGFDEAYMDGRIRSKATNPEDNNYYMDHAFFSACRLYQELVRILKPEKMQAYHIDALTAIMLHNSLFKFAVVGYKSDRLKDPLPAEKHPLAWMLMLCDELQCWDRTAYGRNSRDELHPMAVDFKFTGAAIRAVYYYDREEKNKIAQYSADFAEWKENGRDPEKKPRLKAYSDMAEEEEQRFCRDIGKIVDLGHCPLAVKPSLRKADRRVKHTYLSESSFLHIYNFAVALHARYLYNGKEEKIRQEVLVEQFNNLSLEYKILNINQVRCFDTYLNAIDCFYTDKPVDFDMLPEFSERMVAKFAPMEHVNWVLDHQAKGWHAGNDYEKVPLGKDVQDEAAERKNLRERMRMHKLTMDIGADEEAIKRHYRRLPKADKEKDFLPFNSMLKLLKKFDGVRIYKLR